MKISQYQRGIAPVLMILLLVVVLGGGYWYLKSRNWDLNSFLKPSVSPSISVSPSPSNPIGVTTYTSQKMGVKFNYLITQGSPVLEEGDKIYVGGKSGQWVQSFSKDPNDTITQAIQKQFLQNYSSKNCFVELRTVSGTNSPLPSNIVSAVISYPRPTGQDQAWFENYKKCPPTYSQSNGISYFLMDKNHPGKFFFFSIGQYGILAEPDLPGGGEKLWQDTFEVIK